MTEVTAPAEPAAEDEAEAPTRRLLLFEVGGGAFAAEMSAIREIVPSQAVTRLPGAPPTVSGLINLRGTIVTVIDAGTALRRSHWRRTGGLILLAGYGDGVIGVGIDDVRDIHDATDEQFGPRPADVAEGTAVCGVVEIGGEPVLLLDVPAMIGEILGKGEAG
ncbi:MAG TPA: chemotaxis protein CheW [Gemmatimonadaceae bacterium]|nr:chemotaxis protein CheW [Gemmatimonadaceae bacterium]